MDYLSASETSKKWGITKARVIVLAKEGRIPGAFFCGNQWLIPKAAVKPADARRKQLDNASQDFHFPLLTYNRFTAPSFLRSLSNEEKILLKGQLLFEGCEFNESQRLLEELLYKTRDRYIKIGALYYLCFTAASSNHADSFRSYLKELKSLLDPDLPYKEDLHSLIYDIESLYQGNDYFLEKYKIRNDYFYTKDTIPFLNVQAAFCQALSNKNSNYRYSADINSLSCMHYEQNGYHLVAQRIHLYAFFENIWKKEPDYYHLKKAVEIGICYNSYYILATAYPYLSEHYAIVLKDYDPSILKKIHDTGLMIHKNIVGFIGMDVVSANEILKISERDIRLLNYSVMGYTNKKIAEITGIPEYTVRRNYEKLFNHFDVPNKKQLAIVFKKILADGYR